MTPGLARRRGIRLITVAVVAATGIALGAVAAVTSAPTTLVDFAAPTAGDTTGALGNPPTFPIAEDMQWRSPVGVVGGWTIWVGRSRSNFACIAVARDAEVRAECAPGDRFDHVGVEVVAPVARRDARTGGVAVGEPLVFRWSADRTVAVVAG